jgi:hypothetical protein
LSIAPPAAGKQRAETTLATDKVYRVWLSYLDTDYSQGRQGLRFAWPRRLTVVSSDDEGKTFENPYVISPIGSNASCATDSNGSVYASWVQYFYDDHKHLEVKIVAAQLDGRSSNQTVAQLRCPV